MSETYTKTDLINELASAAKISRRRADLMLTTLAQIAYREAGRGFTVPGICKMDIVHRKERRARNPQTGESLLIGAHDILRVRPLKKAKLAVAPTPTGLITVLPPSPEPAPAAAAPAPLAVAPAPSVVPAVPADVPVAVSETVSADMRLFSFKCPYCRSVIEVTEDCVGDRVSCPACSKPFTVPAIGKPAAPDSAPAPKAAAAAEGDSTTYVSFLCKVCSQEIEAPIDMAGSQAECPACDSVMLIPYVSEAGTSQAKAQQTVDKSAEAYKSRTIRIELPDDI